MNQLGIVLLLWLLPLRLEYVPSASTEWISRGVTHAELEMLQGVTDDLRHRLEITERVLIEVVDHNPLVMSVETLAGRTGPFVITVDRNFIRELRDIRREVFAPVYEKVWSRTGIRGNLIEFIGPPQQ
jgi:hypothetical protein